MKSKRWDPANDDLGGLLFEGAPVLLSQLDELVRRPRSWWRETLLPIIYLVCETTAKNPLDGLKDRLCQIRGVLHSRINGRETPPADHSQPAEKSIRRLLDGVVADLSQGSDRVRPLKFPHYILAVWLASLIMSPTVPPEPDRPSIDDALQDFMNKQMRDRFRLRNNTTKTEINVIYEIPWWVRLPVQLLPPVGIRLMRIFWHPPQWAARNRIATEHSAGSFRGLARKFLEQGLGEQQHDIQPEEVDRLLVDAFMEDLRRDYRRTTLFGAGRRRTTYPILLIDKIEPASASLRLLKLIRDSRTDHLRSSTPGPGRQPQQHAYFHPLLIIAQGDSSALGEIGPSKYQEEDPDRYSVADIEFYYNQWYKALTDYDRTWFIPLRVPTESPRGMRATVLAIPLPAARKPVMMFVSAALLIAATSITTYSTYYTHCGAWYWDPELHRHSLTNDRSQCIGLGSKDHRFFTNVADVNGMDQGLAEDLKGVEDLIYENNELATKEDNYVTVVYLSELTSRDAANYRSELEHLRGIAVAQTMSMADRPVQVLLANAGERIVYGREAAEAIANEAREDDTVVGVVGLGISREGTREAILRLTQPDTRIPVIGTSISATELATKTSKYYHQVGPTNQREAEVGAFYANTRLNVENTTIYYPDDLGDLYSNDLKAQAERAFGALGFTVRTRPYKIDTGDADINLAGREACDVGPDGVVFYAGRGSQLTAFLNGMLGKCGGDYPNIIGGDSVARFVLSGGLRNYPGVKLDYLLQASSLAWGPDCRGAFESGSFFVGYRQLFGDDGVCPGTRSGAALLAHDALLVFTQGLRNTQFPRPSSDAVHGGINDISSESRFGPLRGATGEIDYPRTENQSIPRDKAILVVRGQATGELERRLLCGRLETAQPPPDRCGSLLP